jgi:site-specific DNA recombinase
LVIQAGLYLRMSRDAEARGLGIGRQRKDGEALAGRLGWPIVQEYIDNDLSASKYSRRLRPSYLRMLQDLQEGVINAVVVYDQDRLVRQPKELEELLEVCDRARAWHIAAVSGEIDVRNSDDLFRARILATVHAKESDNISRRSAASSRNLPNVAALMAAHGAMATGVTSVPLSPLRQPGSRSWLAVSWLVSPLPVSAES